MYPPGSRGWIRSASGRTHSTGGHNILPYEIRQAFMEEFPMFSQPPRRQHRATTRHPLLFGLAFMLMLLSPVLDSVAQVIPIQAQATEEPDGPIRVSPTEEPTEEPLPERIPPEAPATEIPAPEPTEEPEPVLPQVLAGTMTIRKGVCDDPAFDF